MHRKILAAALALLFSGLVHATEPLAAKTSARRPAPVKEAPPAESDEAASLPGRVVFQVLAGELALQRGKIETALAAYTDLARRTRDPQVLERATEIAGAARQLELARELAELWVQADPSSQKARQSLTALLVLLNRLDELAPQLSALLEQDKANLRDNLLRLHRMLARHPDRVAVQHLINRVAAPYRDLPEAHYAMATAAANAGDQPRALAEIAETLKKKPDWEMAALLRAQLQARESNLEAIDGLARFLGDNPGATEARLALARLLIAEKRYDESRQHFNRLLRDHPDSPEVIYPIAMLALQQNDLATGKTQLEKLLQGEFPDKSTIHFFLGQIEEEQKRADAALEHYRQVSAGDQYIPARARSAQLLTRAGKFEEARRLLRDTPARSEPEQIQLLLAESQLLRDAHHYEEAYSLLAGALAKRPDNIDLLYESALMADRLGRFDALEARLKRLLEIKPDHAHGLNALGYSLAERNLRLGEAHELIQRALALAPEDPFIMDSLGWVLYRQGKLDESLKVLRQAYGRKPDPEIAAHLGEVLWALDRKEDARRLLREAASKDPDNEVLTAAVRKFLP